MVLNPAAYQGIDHHSAKADTGVDDAQHQALALDEPVVDDGVIGAESTDGMGDAVDQPAPMTMNATPVAWEKIK